LLPNFKRMFEREFLIARFQQLEDIFSIVGTNLRAWFDILCLGANDVSAERPKSIRRKSWDC
jgi:hypothetical protein